MGRRWLGSRHVALAGFVALSALSAGPAAAAPHHDICTDFGSSFAFGVSSYGALRDWAPEAKNTYGADFRALYVYVLAGGMADPTSFEDYYLVPFADTARSMGATVVFTFYQLLDLGRAAGHGGTEAEVVAAALGDPAVMNTYFAHFDWLLAVAAKIGPPVIVQVEPDSWGFMSWAMGVEGNADATTIPVAVAASGYAGLGGFPDHAGGLGHALLALRDAHAPDVRLGWHASNFRAGASPEVTTGMYAAMGDWDVLFSEHPHLEANEATWWDPWDEARVTTNLAWLSTVSGAAGVPIVLWQEPIGTTDYHLLGDGTERAMLGRFAEAGVAAVLFEHIAFQGETDPDTIRAGGALGTAPPPGDPAGGTAADMRARVAVYSQSPLAWPAGSLCDVGVATGGSGGDGLGASGGAAGAGGALGGDASDEAGCACALERGRPAETGPWAWLAALGTLLVAGARRGRSCAR